MKYLLLLIIFFGLGCSDQKKDAVVKGKPKRLPSNFKTAVLYSYDSLHYHSRNPYVAQSAYGGDRMIDTAGTLPKKYFEKHLLDSAQVETLRKFFSEAPCLNTPESTTCIPIFRDAILLYDVKGNYVCQAQICFECQKASFYGKWEVDLCDFDDQTNWKALQLFINEVKGQHH